MTRPLHRFTAPLFAWIPDISAVPLRRQIGIGILVSLLLHGLAFALLGSLGKLTRSRIGFAETPLRPEIELTIEPPPPEEEIPLPFAPRPLPLDNTAGLAASKEAPEIPIFESSQDMKAASERAATGDIPLPDQQGREKTPERPDNQFATQKARAGATTEEPPIVLAPPATEPPSPKPETPPAMAASEPPDLSPKPAEKPEPATLANADPAPPPAVEKPGENEIAISAKPPATPPPIAPPKATVAPPTLAMLTTPSPRVRPSYEQEQEKNRIEGNISSRGKNAVDAVGTPLGKYRKQTLDAIGSRWTYYVKSKTDVLALGSVRVSFFVNSRGRIESLRVQNNTSNQSFAEVCERAIREAEIQPPPAGTVAPLRDGRLEYSINFTLYSFAR